MARDERRKCRAARGAPRRQSKMRMQLAARVRQIGQYPPPGAAKIACPHGPQTQRCPQRMKAWLRAADQHTQHSAPGSTFASGSRSSSDRAAGGGIVGVVGSCDVAVRDDALSAFQSTFARTRSTCASFGGSACVRASTSRVHHRGWNAECTSACGRE